MTEIKREKIGRIGFLFLVFLLLGLFIIAKVIRIQWFEGDQWRQKAEERTYKYIEIDPIRGNILAYDGSLISTNIPLFDIYIDMFQIPEQAYKNDLDSLDYYFTKLFKEKKRGSIYRKLKSLRDNKLPGRRNYLLKRNCSYSEMQKIKKFPVLRETSVLHITKKSKRALPFKGLAARTIGFVNKESTNTRYVGLEGAYDSLLQGASSSQRVKSLSRGYWINENEEEDVRGFDIVTNLDMNIQDVAHSALKRQLIEQDAHHGTAVVMEVETGCILAIANLGKDKNGNYSEVYNYAVGESTEPGSTFKLASMIVALEDGVVDTSEKIKTGNGVKKFHNRRMRDSHHGGFGTISVTECFEKSSNVGISTIIVDNYKNNPEDFVEGIYDLGLNKKLDLEIKGEGRPIIRNPESKAWSKVSLPWMSIGYEVAMTPLQILTFYNGIANNGKVMKPQFVKEISKGGQLIKSFDPVVLDHSLCSQSTIDQVKTMMEGVVDHGTASNLKTTVYQIAGKTGTAQMVQKSGGYNKKDYKASFVGYFPSDNPKYTCIVSVSQPSQGVYYGNRVSGVVFKEIADRLYATRLDIASRKIEEIENGKMPFYIKGKTEDLKNIYAQLNLPLDDVVAETEWTISTPNEDVVRLSTVNMKEDVIPNVTGMVVKDAVYLLEEIGLKPIFNGKGHVKAQSIKAGKKVQIGKSIKLTLI